jgi:hypothetical protein
MEGNQQVASAQSSPDSKALKSTNTSADKRKAKTTNASNPKSAVKPRSRVARSARQPSKEGKLVCRYCGSEDLAPSFKKRRDARCRACFKKRYGSKKAAR